MLGWWITKCGNSGLQSVLGVGLQSALQSALGFTKCGRLDYKVRQGLQSVAGLQSELVHCSCRICVARVWHSCYKLGWILNFKVKKYILANMYLISNLSICLSYKFLPRLGTDFVKANSSSILPDTIEKESCSSSLNTSIYVYLSEPIILNMDVHLSL